MALPKTSTITYLALALITAVAIFYVFKAHNLEQELTESETVKRELTEKMTTIKT